ncbi:hypothetical protein QFZ24_005686 [Streptomyces phaeochromogenes]|nr:hypothetical protein [Streptomyces phaeochromogenes]
MRGSGGGAPRDGTGRGGGGEKGRPCLRFVFSNCSRNLASVPGEGWAPADAVEARVALSA